MRELEDYYRSIGNVLNKSLPLNWSKAFVHAPIYGSCIGGMEFGAVDAAGATLDVDIPWDEISNFKEFFIKIRDSLLEKTGQRIWGIRFEIFPEGRFSAHFEYEPPSWYDKDDDPLMSWEQISELSQDEVSMPPGTNADEAAGLRWLQEKSLHDADQWGLGEEKSWDMDLEQGRINWRFSNRETVSAQVQVMGTRNSKDGSFLWAWDHPSISQPLRKAAENSDWAASRGIAEMTTRKSTVDELKLWCWLGLTAREYGANGGYRVNSNGTWVYLVYMRS